jgi:hypothetical protein
VVVVIQESWSKGEVENARIARWAMHDYVTDEIAAGANSVGCVFGADPEPF